MDVLGDPAEILGGAFGQALDGGRRAPGLEQEDHEKDRDGSDG